LIDGNMQSNNLVNATWYPKESITITYTLSSSTGDHRVKVVTENGISAYGNYTTTE
jgi:archaellum component FlaF (FlaF/FlaG flagellin family)